MKLLPILLSLALLLSLTGCGRSDAGANSMTVLYLDVGKADCTILTDGAHTVLIDCAETDDGETILSVLKENRISQIDLLIVTHFDKDHIGGVPEVLSSFSVLHVIEPDYAPENPEAEAYTAYRAALELASITPEAVSDALDVMLGDMQLSILGAGGAAYEKNTDNNNSLVVTVTHCENRFFFAGDIEKQRIADLLEAGVSSCDVLKVPHHGVYNKQLPALFAALGMKEAVITCSEKNPANSETIDRLDALGCRVWQTVNGTVRVISNQNGITISQK